ETVWHLLRQHHVPTFIFINKIDRDGASVANVMMAIQKEFSQDALLLTEPITENALPEHVLEWIAERDEHLLELYMEGAVDPVIFFTKL
ncbi:GTP-binding protein, partial [Pseudomonas sp. SIMBA_059]